MFCILCSHFAHCFVFSFWCVPSRCGRFFLACFQFLGAPSGCGGVVRSSENNRDNKRAEHEPNPATRRMNHTMEQPAHESMEGHSYMPYPGGDAEYGYPGAIHPAEDPVKLFVGQVIYFPPHRMEGILIRIPRSPRIWMRMSFALISVNLAQFLSSL